MISWPRKSSKDGKGIFHEKGGLPRSSATNMDPVLLTKSDLASPGGGLGWLGVAMVLDAYPTKWPSKRITKCFGADFLKACGEGFLRIQG